jgi:lysophospholipid hydrolase
VVDGTVQVFAHTGQVEQTDELSWDDENMNGYQLINEVGSGGTLSSLFTILSLFTEDVPVSWQGDQSKALTFSPARSRMYRSDSDVSRLELSSRPRGESTSSAASTVHAPRHESFSLPGTPDGFTESASFARPNTPLHSHSIARATEDSTLAVIPAEAFRRLTKRFPKATGHIVQGK